MRKNSFSICILILLMTGFIFVACEKANNHSDATPETLIDSVVSADGINIIYEVNGPESDVALVFVHCWSCDRTYWSNQIPVFSKDHKVVSIDLAGHGESALGREAWTMAAYGQDVTAVISKLGLKKVVLIGHSMGGSVIVQASKLLKEKPLALIGVDNFDAYGIPIPEEAVSGYIGSLRANFLETTKGFVGTIIGPKADSSLRQWIIDDMSGGDATVGVESMLEILNYAYSEDVINDLTELNIPLYLINAPVNVARLDNVKAAVPALDIRVQDSVAHFGHMTKPEEFNSFLKDIIKDISTE